MAYDTCSPDRDGTTAEAAETVEERLLHSSKVPGPLDPHNRGSGPGRTGTRPS